MYNYYSVNDFDNMSKTIFNFLVKDYGYKLEKTEKVGFGYYTRFINETSKTKVEIWLDIRDRWQSCSISHFSNDTTEYKDMIDFYELHILKAPNVKVNYGSSNEEEAYLQFADVLKEYGQDVLRGDFSACAKIIRNNSPIFDIRKRNLGNDTIKE